MATGTGGRPEPAGVERVCDMGVWATAADER